MSFATIVSKRIFQQFAKIMSPNRSISHLTFHHEKPEEFVCRYKCFFERQDIDGWDVRQGMNDLMAYDAVPDPEIVIAALIACRRINDYALTVRFLEAVRNKCGNQISTIWPYLVEEIAPTVADIGCDFPKDLGYDKPELYLKSGIYG